MKLITLPDLHERTEYLGAIHKELARADVVLLPGDLANGNGAAGAARVIDAVREVNPNVLAIPGNWDDADTSSLLTDKGVNLDRRHVVRNGVGFIGVGGALHSPKPSKNSATEEEFAEALDEAVEGLDASLPWVLICHQPPADARTDLAASGKHVGSIAIRSFIERTQPLICFTGHIHEAAGIDKIGRTILINPGPLWEGWYASAEVSGQRARARCHRLLFSSTSL